MPVDVNKQLSEIRETQKELDIQARDLQMLEKLQKELECLRREKEDLVANIQRKKFVAELQDIPNVERKSLELDAAKLEEKLKEMEMRIAETEKKIEMINATIARKKHFDKYLVFRNIRELLKDSEVKLGQIEKEAGCQPGYMSRLDKAESATDPTVEFLVTAAKLLNVSVDVLLNAVLQELTPTERYIISFLEKMIRDTDADKLDWNRETDRQLQTLPINEEGNVAHVLFHRQELVIQVEGADNYKDERPVFYSRAFDEDTEIGGDCYNLRMKNESRLYLMNVESMYVEQNMGNVQVIEAWMWQRRQGASFLCSTQNNSVISKLVKELYDAVAQNVKHPKVRKNVQAVIDAFMQDDLEDDPLPKINSDELPF